MLISSTLTKKGWKTSRDCSCSEMPIPWRLSREKPDMIHEVLARSGAATSIAALPSRSARNNAIRRLES